MGCSKIYIDKKVQEMLRIENVIGFGKHAFDYEHPRFMCSNCGLELDHYVMLVGDHDVPCTPGKNFEEYMGVPIENEDIIHHYMYGH